VIWLDVPSEQLVERLRAARREDIEVDGSVRTFIADHLAAYHPYYFAGTRVDASGSISDTIDRIGPFLDRPPGAGTLVLRAEPTAGWFISAEVLSRSMAHVLERLRARRCVVLTSARSRARADDAAGVVREVAGIPVDVEELPDGEPSKLLEEQEHLYRRLADRQLERRDPLLAIGDDALLEAGTFAAAVWLRGVPLITVPVTTLGLIDTAIGGKGGIDLSGVGRNLLGSIHQPMATILDVALVEDESAEDRRAALRRRSSTASSATTRCCRCSRQASRGQCRPWPRGASLSAVERCAGEAAPRRPRRADTEGIRVALNLGHTMSHALEAATGYRLGHGEAVAYGLRTALELDSTMGVTPGAVAARGVRLLDGLGLGMARLEIPLDGVLGYIEADKKRRDGRTRWVLVGADGITIRGDVPAAMVRTAAAAALAGRIRG
jgi:3-dehydroquinate synthetase